MARDNYTVPELKYAPAKRGASNVLVLLAGTFGTGKTRSSLELAVGLAEGGLICMADTEHSRALAYADKFQFEHLPLAEPFRPELFEQAAMVAQKKGAKVWICDNFSWEHIGPGGMLQWHAAELKRMAGDNYARQEQLKMTAWIEPKAAHTAMLQRFWQLNCHIIISCMAKKKIEMVRNEKGKMAPTDRGWQPICGDDIPYAMSTALMLHPGRPGYPTIIKPNEFLEPFIPLDRPLNADVGRALAAWARGETPVAPAPLPASAASVNAYPDAMGYVDSGEPPHWDGEPDDAPPPEDPAMLKWMRDLAADFLNTADRQAHLKLVNSKGTADRVSWLKKHAKAAYDRELAPAIKASWIRTDDTKQADAGKEKAATEELPL